MGFTLPPLPPPPSLLNPFQRGVSLPGLRPKDGFYFDIMPPDWAEDIPDYHISSCWWKGAGACGAMVVMTYMADAPCNCVRGFAKVYALVDVDPYEKTGNPFPQMKGIWKELCRHNKRGQYTISEDGRIRNDIGDFPSDNDVKAAIYDISSLYDSWAKFPKAEDWNAVQKLYEALGIVEQFKDEEKNHWAQDHIGEMRQKIKELQNDISQVEKNLNEMYEKAADSMNLLEEHGIVVNLDEEPKEPEKQSVDCDIASLYPTSLLKFIGEATIVRMQDGSYVVTPKPLNHHPNAGDIVVDRSNGMTAVYSYGKWEVVNP